jgi:hypothetical protein
MEVLSVCWLEVDGPFGEGGWIENVAFMSFIGH